MLTVVGISCRQVFYHLLPSDRRFKLCILVWQLAFSIAFLYFILRLLPLLDCKFLVLSVVFVVSIVVQLVSPFTSLDLFPH